MSQVISTQSGFWKDYLYSLFEAFRKDGSQNVSDKEALLFPDAYRVYEECVKPLKNKERLSPTSFGRLLGIMGLPSERVTVNIKKGNKSIQKRCRVIPFNKANQLFQSELGKALFLCDDLVVSMNSFASMKKAHPHRVRVDEQGSHNDVREPVPEQPKISLSTEREKHYKKLWSETQEEVGKLSALVSLYSHLDDPRPPAPEFMASIKSSSADNHVVFCTILSDTHFSEVVNPAHVNNVNVYNREIAKGRLQTYFEKIVSITSNYIKGITMDGIVLCLGGDMVSGIIHEELKETNEKHMLEECVYWADNIVSGIKYIHDKLKRPIYIPCVVGNHGRLTKKPTYKYRAEDNLDYLMYLLIQKSLQEYSDITVDIARSSEIPFTVYDTTYILCHGDEFRGGKGISGIYTPISLGRMRKQERELSLNRTYDILLMGHFHQLLYGGNFIINGSLIGANEYSYMNSMKVEPPQQAFWLSSPRGITMFGPIFVESYQNHGFSNKVPICKLI